MKLPSFITNPNPDIYLSNNYCVLDLETTNVDYGDARNNDNYIVYGSLSLSSGKKYHITSIQRLFNLCNILYSVDFVVAHNTKFEIKWLIRAGVDVSRILFYDTMLGDYVRSGNRGWKLGLDAVCSRYDVPLKHTFISALMELGVCPSDMPFSAVQKYCKNDVDITHKVFLKQRELLKQEGLLPVFFIRNITTPVISDMEMNGMYLDNELVQEVATEFNSRYNQIMRELDELTGGINMASTHQVANFLYKDLKFNIPRDRRGNPIVGKPTEDWPEGLPLTNEDSISLLVPKTEKQKRFIELKKEESKLRKKITGYVNRFIEICKKDNPIMFGTINQHVTDTHRLSSSKPNLQNTDKKLKKVVKARRPGWKIFNADYAGIEFRIGGELSRDPQVLDDIINKFDVHSYTASIVFADQWIKAGACRIFPNGVENEACEALRSDAKPDTFGPMYGKVSGTPGQIKYFEAFRKKYHVMTAVQNGWVDEVLDKGYLTTVTGLKLYYPGTEYTKSGYVINSTKIKNHPIQMFATADVAPTGVALLWYNMKVLGLKSFLIAEIHDSGMGEVPENEITIMTDLANKCMSKDIVSFFKQVIGYEITYPIEVEIKIRSNWDYDK